MKKAVQPEAQRLIEPMRIADHPVLDLLNTVAIVDGERVDFFQNDTDVSTWLEKAGFPIAAALNIRSGKLLDTARNVREVLRDAIERQKAGKPISLAPLNELLSKSSSHLALSQDRHKGLQLTRIWPSGSVEQMLGPIVESAADLLATGDFDLIRSCEDQNCILWFYDRTKSHHRRWCSMATCGNRFKVAAFRERRRASSL